MSLRARITLAAVTAVAVCGALAAGALLAGIERDGRQAIDRDLEQRAERTLPGRRGGPPAGTGFDPGRRPRAGRPPEGGPDPLLAGSGTFTQVAIGPTVVEQRGDVPAGAPAPPAQAGFETVEIDGEPWRSLTVSPAHAPQVRVQLLTTLEPLEQRLDRIRGLVAVIGAVALALTAAAAWALTALAVRPLGRLQAGAARITGAADLDRPLPDDDGPAEVRSLASSLNAMLARLERAMQATRRFAADAGHELRTPLTALRANLDTLQRNPDLPAGERAAVVGEMVAGQERMTRLLEGLQALARGEAAESIPREKVEIGDVADAAVVDARRRFPAVTFELDDRIGDDRVRGWPDGLRRTLDNLLENAAVHGRPDGTVRVLLARAEDAVVIEVDDDGPGIPAADRDRMLEPFARGTGATAPGSGLGMAIVARQVALHGGDIELVDSRLGGLSVRLRLPLARE